MFFAPKQRSIYRIIISENVYTDPYESTQIYKTLAGVREHTNVDYFHGSNI